MTIPEAKRPRIACLFNYAPHYRAPIYRLMDDQLACDFYFGSNLPGEHIQKMDVTSLRGFKGQSPTYRFRYSWQSGYPWLSIGKYDVFIVTADASLSSVVLLGFCRLLRKPLFLWGHGPLDESARISRPLRWLYLRAAGWFLYGDRARRILIGLGAKSSVLHVVYNSLDYDRQLALRQTLAPSDVYQRRFGNDGPVLSFVGRLTPQKKLEMLIAAAADLNDAGVVVNTVIVGSGGVRSTLEKMAEARGIAPRVWFYGPCYDEQALSEVFFNASLCVSPGNVGLTAMHAMAYGCPVVTHDDFNTQGPECEAIVDGVTGGFFRSGDNASLVQAILRTLSMDRAATRRECYRMIEQRYNPHRQIETIRSALIQ